VKKALERGLWLAAAFAAIAISAGSAGAGAAPDRFGGAESTAAGLPTYDADQINVERVTQTGKGVYVAVLDTGLVSNWRDYFPEQRVAEELGTGFDQPVRFKSGGEDPCTFTSEAGSLRQSTWVGSTGPSGSHGTHVASTILGYYYDANADTAGGLPMPPVMVRGIAPEVTVIPVRVLADYQMPARPKCTDANQDISSHTVNFGTDEMIAAGIKYVTGLANRGFRPIVINMSLGGDELSPIERQAIDNAIGAGVIVVAAAGNDGEEGMHFPGAYPPVISAGASGWAKEWFIPGAGPRYRLWWLQGDVGSLLPGSGEVAEPTPAGDVFVAEFSGRAKAGQDLDVLAPGNWVRGPFAGDPGYSHLPWWSHGIGDITGNNPGNFFYVGGTSQATPHVSGAAAMLLEKNPSLTQAQVESLLTSTALPIPASGSMPFFDFDHPSTISWDTDCDGTPCDAVGSGLLQVDKAIAATP
jgi:subtilisin family serine protease